MQPTAYDLKSFYNAPAGQVVRDLLRGHITAVWPETKGLRILGTGYAIPYMGLFGEETERAILHMPIRQGAHHWPLGGKNLVAVSEAGRLPFESNSIDRVLMIHALEFFDDVAGNLEEVWRVLRPNGRLLIIVPNRTALWAQADWTPFGKGRPYTASQLSNALMDNRFVYEQQRQALYLPPLSWPPILRAAPFLEKYSRYVWPMGGVHMVEASKQLYAPVRKDGSGSKVPVERLIGGVRPVPQMRAVNR